MLAEIEQLVRQGMPTRVGVGVRQVGRGEAAALHPLEEEYLGPRATDRRRVMFTLGRAAARAALNDLGFGSEVRGGAGATPGVVGNGVGSGVPGSGGAPQAGLSVGAARDELSVCAAQAGLSAGAAQAGLSASAARDGLSAGDGQSPIGDGAAMALAIGRGPGGEPLWPKRIVGAISHSGDLAVAVVGWADEYAGLGVDVEQRSPGMSLRAARLVCRPSEYAWATEDPGPMRRTQVFSAKEAIFKALYPIEGVWLGFGDAELHWDAARCGFNAEVLKAAGTGFPVGTKLDVSCGVTASAIVSTTFARRAA